MGNYHGVGRHWLRWYTLLMVLLISTWALAVTSGSYLAYFTSAVDDSQQFYGIYIPTSYRQFSQHPVIFIGHGFKGSATNSFTSYQRSFANSYGYLLVQVHGRGNSFYDGIGETDFFEVLANLKSSYTLDENRLYFEGASMGATGAYRMGIRFPDIFAAVGGCDGFADYRAWYTQYYSPAGTPEEIEVSRLPNLEMASCVDTAVRAKWQHIWMTVDSGDNSVYPANTYNLHYWLDVLANATPEADYQYIFDLKTGDHTAGYNQQAMYPYFRNITNNRYPKQVKLVTNRLKYGKQYWVRVDRLQTANVFAVIEAVVSGNTINVTASNVLAYTLTLDANLINTGQPVSIRTNGVLSYVGSAGAITLYAQQPGDVNTNWWTIDPEASRLWKKAGLEGPIGDAFTSRFIVFYGAGGTETETIANRTEAQDFCSKWALWMNATITPHPDTDLLGILDLPNWSGTAYGNSNIVLFGTIESSILLNALQSQLPVAVSENGTVVGTTVFSGSQYGAFFTYPNPKNSQKYLVVSHGKILVPTVTQQTWISDPAAYAKDLEALPWYWPDYVVFRTDVTPRVTVQEKLAYLPDAFVLAGYFDTNWQLPISYRPDLQIGSSESSLIGDDIYDLGEKQSITRQAPAGTLTTFYVLVQNDGNQADTFFITGSGDSSAAMVRYYLGTQDVTASIIALNGLPMDLAAGASQFLRVEAGLTGAESSSVVTVTATSLTPTAGVPVTDTVIANLSNPLVITAFTADKLLVCVGEPVNLTVNSTGGYNVQYQFQIGSLLSAWSTSNMYTWTPSAAGTYPLRVYAQSGQNVDQQVATSTDDCVVTPPLPPTITSFTVNPTTNAVVGTPVQLTTVGTGGYNVQYQFQIGSQLTPWSISNTYTWTPTAVGTYTLTSYARSGDTGASVSKQITGYVVSNPPLTKVTLQTMPTSVKSGATVNLTATPTGGGMVEYRFVYTLNGVISVIREWGTINTCTWKSGKRGSYTLTVYAREIGTTAMVSGSIPYTVK